MALEARKYGNATVVKLVGRLDHDNCDAVRADIIAALERAGGGAVLVLDLSRLSYVSSAGLRCFMLVSRQAKAQQGRLLAAAAQPMVGEIFEISRFNLLFPIYQTLREALAAVSSEAAEAFDGA